jgi:hypothetical protein
MSAINITHFLIIILHIETGGSVVYFGYSRSNT